MAEPNHNSRLEAFCDGVFAIALTLLIIDIKIPPTEKEKINDTAGLWLALNHVTPSILAFVLSFIIILIGWVNHHNAIKLVNRSCSSFIYANGFLLLTVVFMPFPTALMGEYIFTDHSAPAVILYNVVIALNAMGWILICKTALKNRLAKNEKANLQIRKNGKFGFFAFVLYTICAIMAIWFPLAVAIITIATWIFWLIYGISMKHEEMN